MGGIGVGSGSIGCLTRLVPVSRRRVGCLTGLGGRSMGGIGVSSGSIGCLTRLVHVSRRRVGCLTGLGGRSMGGVDVRGICGV